MNVKGAIVFRAVVTVSVVSFIFAVVVRAIVAAALRAVNVPLEFIPPIPEAFEVVP
jgi:hypothetical protein